MMMEASHRDVMFGGFEGGERRVNQGMQTTSRSWKRQGTDFPLETLEKNTTLLTL